MLFNCHLDKNAYCMSINEKRFEYLSNNFIFTGMTPPKLYKCVRWKNGSNVGCLIGHISLIMIARTLNLPWITIYEDDAFPRPDVLWWFEKIKSYVPNDCGLLKIGSSSIRRGHRAVNDYIFETQGDGVSFGSHAYIIRRECYDSFLEYLEDARVPDVAMSFKYFKNNKYKSYGLFLNCMLFAQKNIDTDNIISSKGGQRYWYINPKNYTGCTTGTPPPGFSDILFDDDNKYVKPICVVMNENWKNKKKTASIEDNILKTKDDEGKLIKLDDITWKIQWKNSDVEEYLRYDENKTGTDFYKIVNTTEYKYYTFLLCMTSYNRPLECMCQIHRFFNSSYNNFIMSVIVRGVDDNVYNNQILPDVQKYIDSGRLIISKKENSNFLNNLLQCTDQCNKKWDYFFKIDDDDWYHPDYLKTINHRLNNFNSSIPVGGYCDPSTTTITYKQNNMIKEKKNNSGLCGGTIFVNSYIYEILKKIRDDTKNTKKILKDNNIINMSYTTKFEAGMCEDRLMCSLIDYISNRDNVPKLVITKEHMYSIYRIYGGVLRR